MALPLEQIDTSVIEELVGLKRDRAVLAARLERMAAEADKVSPAVFQRVQADYQARLATLDGSAAPLKDQARREYVKLRRQLDEVGAQRAAAQQDQEELELRHRLGEFEASEFSAKGAEVAQRVTALDRELAAVTAVRERFVAAFDSEDELAQSPPEADAAGLPDGHTPPNVASAPSAPDVPDVPSTPRLAGPPAEPAAPTGLPAAAKGGARSRPVAVPAAVAPAAASPAATLAGSTGVRHAPAAPADPEPPVSAAPAEPMRLPQEAQAAPTPPALAAEPAPPPPAPPLPSSAGTLPAQLLGGTVILSDLPRPAADANLAPGGTMIVAFGRLVPLDEAAGTSELSVQPFTTIGRTRQNLVQLDAPSVSRKHAQIVLTEGGYVLRDLGSENGTFVNGERVTERLLAEGDHLQFGSVRFSFHAA